MGGFLSGLASSGEKIVKKIKDRSGKKQQATTSKSSDSDSSGGGFYGSDVTSYHKGGIVKKTGLARLKKGERVLTKSQQRKLPNRKRMRGK